MVYQFGRRHWRSSQAFVEFCPVPYLLALLCDRQSVLKLSREERHATSVAIAGAVDYDQTGHRSVQIVRRYIRDSSLFRDNSGWKVGVVVAYVMVRFFVRKKLPRQLRGLSRSGPACNPLICIVGSKSQVRGWHDSWRGTGHSEDLPRRSKRKEIRVRLCSSKWKSNYNRHAAVYGSSGKEQGHHRCT